MDDPGRESRENAAVFGRKTEDALDDFKKGVDALRGEQETSPDDTDGHEGGGDINITINR